jgi:hypothetical protein
MRKDIYIGPNPDFTGEFDVLSNAGNSSYNALQAQCRHRLSHGLQTLLSYTWGSGLALLFWRQWEFTGFWRTPWSRAT